MSHRVKFKVGQVWARASDKFKYRIISIVDKTVKAEESHTKKIVNFIIIDSDGTAEIDTRVWGQIVPRECLCGTNRNVCIYHKLESYQLME